MANTLSALDFIINVLREHEKELTVLSERLENTLEAMAREDVSRSLTELSHSIQELSNKIDNLSRNEAYQADMESHSQQIILSLVDQNERQRLMFKEIIEQFKALPTEKDIRN